MEVHPSARLSADSSSEVEATISADLQDSEPVPVDALSLSTNFQELVLENLQRRSDPSDPLLEWPLTLLRLVYERGRSSRLSSQTLDELQVEFEVQANMRIIEPNLKIRRAIDIVLATELFQTELTNLCTLQNAAIRNNYFKDAKQKCGELTAVLLSQCLGGLKDVGIPIWGKTFSSLTSASPQWAAEKPYDLRPSFSICSRYTSDQQSQTFDTAGIVQIGVADSSCISSMELFAILCLARGLIDTDDKNLQSYTVSVISIRGSCCRKMTATVPRTYFQWLLQPNDPIFQRVEHHIHIKQTPYFDIRVWGNLRKVLKALLDA